MVDNNMDSIKLKLGEENSLKFKLQIQGITSNKDETKPKIRFIINEKKDESSGVMLPVIKEETGVVSVTFDAPTSKFAESELYEGKIEVIIGNRIFEVAKYDISFIAEPKVLVESLVVNQELTNKEESIKPTAKLIESNNQNNEEIKSKVRKALSEKLNLPVSDPKLENLVEIAYKKFQEKV